MKSRWRLNRVAILPAKVVREVVAQAVACCHLANDNALAPFSRVEKCKNNLTTSNLRDRLHHARVCALKSLSRQCRSALMEHSARMSSGGVSCLSQPPQNRRTCSACVYASSKLSIDIVLRTKDAEHPCITHFTRMISLLPPVLLRGCHTGSSPICARALEAISGHQYRTTPDIGL